MCSPSIPLPPLPPPPPAGFSTNSRVAGKEESPLYRTIEPAGGVGSRLQMMVGPGPAAIRPYVVCAVLRGVAFDAKNYKNFIDLQVRPSRGSPHLPDSMECTNGVHPGVG